MKQTILLIIIIGSLFIINTSFVTSCSCIQPASPQEELDQATAVFAGKVISVDMPRGMFVDSADPVIVTFEVSRIWKGPDYKTIVLTTPRDSASCGVSFEKDETYIVYANGDTEDSLSASLCSRTTLLANAQEDLLELGESISPTNQSSNYESESSNLNRNILIAIIAAIVLGTIIFLIIRHKK